MQTLMRYKRILESGGMLVLGEAHAQLFRSVDARRSVVGKLTLEQIDDLIAEDVLEPMADSRARKLVWRKGKGIPDTKKRRPCGTSGPPPEPAQRKARARNVLEYILRAETDEARQAYLQTAAVRFQRDIERYSGGAVLTMNWEFVPNGKVRGQSSGEAMRSQRIDASQRISQLQAVLGDKEMRFLQAVIIEERSLNRLALDFGLKRVDLAKAGLAALKRLAQTYDRTVKPERE